MKVMNRGEAIIAMMDGKQVTSDEFDNPDETYCMYDKTIKDDNPFRYVNHDGIAPMCRIWSTKTWRLRKYTPTEWYELDSSAGKPVGLKTF